MSDGGFSLLGTPLSIAISIAAVLSTAALGVLAWRRSGYSTSMGILEVLRTSIVATIALLLNQPEWVEQYRPDVKRSVAVLWDDSRSMLTQDVEVTDDSVDNVAITRTEAIAPLIESSAWAQLSNQYDIQIQPISEATRNAPSQFTGTDLSAPILGAAASIDNLSAVVLISDGDWNVGPPPVDAASRLRVSGIPIFSVAVGSPARLPDIALANLELPSFGAMGKPVRIPFSIDSSIPREFVTTVTLQTSRGETMTQEVAVAAMTRTNGAFNWKPEDIGDYTLTVNVGSHIDETITDNNARSAPISVREEKLKVLIVESFPRWEYRYLRNALSRDPGVDVSCLLFHPRLEKVGGGSKDYIKEFPEAIEDLATYDVVFLGDVGIEPGQLTSEQCELIKGLVEFQASGLVFMPGLSGRQFSLLNSELSDLYPVVLDKGQRKGWGSQTPGRFELSKRGRGSLLTKLANSELDNAQVWEDLPGFQWHAPVVRSKAGSEVLAVHGDMSNEYGRLPLLVTRTFGAGKVLFMGTDGAWRWRKGVEDKYHYRFWGQVVRWMAYQRNMAKGETMRVFYSPEQPELRQTLTLSAHVMDSTGEPLQEGDVVATIIAPSGSSDSVNLMSEGEESWGVFEGNYTTREPGKHNVIFTCEQTSASLETSFFVQGQTEEDIGNPARPDVLEELSLVTRGKSVEPQEIESVLNLLSALPQPPPSVRRLQLWSHPAIAGLVVLLLGTFWVYRKLVGLF